MIRSSVFLAVCLGLWSCTSDPTADEAGVPTAIVASPEVNFVTQGTSELIKFGLTDELGGLVPSTWSIGNVPPEFTVTFDSTYRVVYNPDGTLVLPDNQSEIRVTVTGEELGAGTFTVSASGKSLSVTVNVVPGYVAATFVPSNPAPGELVTMTMPPTLELSDASVITFPGNLAPQNLTIAADHKSATFLPPPTVHTTATITQVVNLDFPTLPAVTLPSLDTLSGTMSGTWDGKLPATLTPSSSEATPNATGALTVTLAPGYAFGCAPDCSVPANVTSAFTFENQTAPNLVSISADSSVVNLAIGPNVSQPLQATKITFKGAPTFVYTLLSQDTVYTPKVPSVPVTISPTNPQVGDTVTITAGAGYAFGPGAQVSWPLGSTAIIADTTWTTNNTQIRVLPMPGSSGLPTITKVVVLSSPTFQLTLPATAGTPLTMQATSIYGGDDDTGTATLLTLPPIGTDTLEFYDLMGSPTIDKFYQISPGTAVTLSTQLDWGNGSDVDLLNCNSDCSAYFGGFAGATGAKPENMANVAYPAGSYYVWANLYDGANPPWIKVRIIRIN